MITAIRYEELDVLLNDLFTRYGYDFTEYSKASLQRRVQRLFTLDKFPSFAEFRHRLQHDPSYFRRFELDFRGAQEALKRNPIFVKVKFHTPELSAKRPYDIEVVAGPPESPQRVGAYRSLAAEASHEIVGGPSGDVADCTHS